MSGLRAKLFGLLVSLSAACNLPTPSGGPQPFEVTKLVSVSVQTRRLARHYTSADMQELWCGPTRIYFNAWEDAPRYWSADQGFGTPEITAERVSFAGAEMITVVNAASKEQPRAWMQGDVRVVRRDSGELVVERLPPRVDGGRLR